MSTFHTKDKRSEDSQKRNVYPEFKTYRVTLSYSGEVEAEDVETIENAIFEVLELIGDPFNQMLELDYADIECEDDEE